MINPSEKLSPQEKTLVEESFENAIDEMGQAEFTYLDTTMEEKIRSVQASGTWWVTELGKHCQALYQIYLDYFELKDSGGYLPICDHDIRMISAALWYFANPLDIIPDYTAGRGYLDDAHAVNLCIKRLNKSEPGYFQSYYDRI